jgi:hypothetical protein
VPAVVRVVLEGDPGRRQCGLFVGGVGADRVLDAAADLKPNTAAAEAI